MAIQILNFNEALQISNSSKRHLLVGNGFSIDWKKDIFRYDSLFEQGDFQRLNANAKSMFGVLGTKDFEIVMRYLNDACSVLKIYDPKNRALIEQLEKDATELKNVLINAIASSHPEDPTAITDDEYDHCRAFLINFHNVYTLNYDLLVYWVFMHFPNDVDLMPDDGFRTPDAGKVGYVSWDIEKTDGQNLFYLHGALHIFDAGPELQKYTWINTGIKLIDQIREALEKNLLPLFVSEGTSEEKVQKITHSSYLSRGLRSFCHVGGDLFVHGHSLADNDRHVLNLIPKSNIKRLFVSLHGDHTTPGNQKIIEAAQTIINKRQKKTNIELHFYSSESANVWRDN